MKKAETLLRFILDVQSKKAAAVKHGDPEDYQMLDGLQLAAITEAFKNELTGFLNFLLINGYCDSDVYSEPPSAIDRYMHQ